MNSLLKYGGVALVIALVFGATLVSMYTGNQDVPDEKGPDGAVVGQPLQFVYTDLSYVPGAEKSPAALFSAFHEPGEEHHRAAFWFSNPHPVPVRVRVVGRSCSACTSARVGVVAPGRFETFQQWAALDALTFGPLPRVPVLGPPAGAALLDSITWHDLEFEHPDSAVEIPAAPPGGQTWGVLVLFVKLFAVGPKTINADLAAAVPNGAPVVQRFHVTLVGVNPFELTPSEIDLGEMAEGTPPQSRDVYYWSQSNEHLPPPTIGAGTDPFVRVGTPVLLTPPQRAGLVASLAAEGKVTKVVSGYRIPVTVYRRLPDATPNAPAELDIGPFDRRIPITGPGGGTIALTLTGRVTGLVSLIDGYTIDLKDFNGRSGVEKTVNLISDRPNLKLEPLPGDTRPAYLKVELSEPRTEATRRFWTAKVTIPPGACADVLPTDSVIAFKATTPDGVRKVRIPVKGTGFTRGR